MDRRRCARFRQTHCSPLRRLLRWPGVLLIALPVLLIGCGNGVSPTVIPSTVPTPTRALALATVPPARPATVTATAGQTPGITATRIASPSVTATRGTMNYPEVVGVAIAALATETGLPREQIVVSRFEAREWPDSSLGCPQPGRAYLQVVTPGYLIILAAGGREYEYHTTERGMIVRCSP